MFRRPIGASSPAFARAQTGAVRAGDGPRRQRSPSALLRGREPPCAPSILLQSRAWPGVAAPGRAATYTIPTTDRHVGGKRLDADESSRLRDRLAAHRTLLAWLRTGISLAALGFVVAKFGIFLDRLAPGRASTGTAHLSGGVGVALTLVGALLMGAGFWQHRAVAAHIGGGGDLPEWPVVAAFLICAGVAVLLAVYLLVSGT